MHVRSYVSVTCCIPLFISFAACELLESTSKTQAAAAIWLIVLPQLTSEPFLFSFKTAAAIDQS